MTYYDYERALHALNFQVNAYALEKSAALSYITQNITDVRSARIMLMELMIQFRGDCTIYPEISKLALRIGAFDILAKSGPRALRYNQLSAQCHYDFGFLLY